MLFSDFYSKLSSSSESEKRLSCMDTGSSSRRASAYGSIGSKMGTKGKERAAAEEVELVSAGRATIVMFHGNAMTHGDVIDLAAQFLNMGCNVLTVSYRGYGHSTGRPSEGGTLLFCLLLLFPWRSLESRCTRRRLTDISSGSPPSSSGN
jgi:pimeloyl-ACP methyl ester carboxylesterase